MTRIYSEFRVDQLMEHELTWWCLKEFHVLALHLLIDWYSEGT